ncbi:MAG: hypothetical protein M1814_000543 [Vezdaea aestivalis]|nr:MAG: hypothetical protein M1814_000543 [Vezdaea aestivalis]
MNEQLHYESKLSNDPSQNELYGLSRFPQYDSIPTVVGVLGAGDQGEVFHVLFNGKEYALKVFNPYLLGDPPMCPYDLPLHDIYRYSAPFALECAALAHLQKQNLDGNIAVKCYGWIRIKHETWNKRMPRSCRRLCSPFGSDRWAIVKDVVKTDIDAPSEQMRQALQECVRGIADAGIIDMDVRPENFMGNPPAALDFGSCITKSHFRYRRERNIKFREQNLGLIAEWTVKNGKFSYSPPPLQ